MLKTLRVGLGLVAMSALALVLMFTVPVPAATTPQRHTTCMTITYAFRTATGHEADDVTKLCGYKMPVESWYCPVKNDYLPSPGTLVSCTRR